MNKMLTRCAVLAMGAVFATGCVGTLESPHPGVLSGVDARGDAYGSDPRGDLDLWGVRYSLAQIELYMKPASLGNPANDANWTQRNSLITWEVETTNDFGTDFTVISLLATDGTFLVGVFDSQDNLTCRGTGTYNGSQEMVSLLDPVACFGGRGPIRVRAGLSYDSLRETTDDESPDYPDWSEWVAPSAS